MIPSQLLYAHRMEVHPKALKDRVQKFAVDRSHPKVQRLNRWALLAGAFRQLHCTKQVEDVPQPPQRLGAVATAAMGEAEGALSKSCEGLDGACLCGERLRALPGVGPGASDWGSATSWVSSSIAFTHCRQREVSITR